MSTPGLLALSAVAMIASIWLRLLPLGYASPVEASRYEDFVDLLLPFVMVGPALVVLARIGAARRVWALALLSAIVLLQGHGVHLSANAINYASGPADPAYLWDEQIGHYLWLVGSAALLLVVTAAARPLRAGPLPALLAAVVGLSWAAGTVEAGSVPLGASLAVGLTAYGVRRRADGTGRLLVLAYGLSLVLMAVYGIVQGGFPQPSELGWL